MPDEKRMVENYEVTTAIQVGGKEIIFAEDAKSPDPFMVCDCRFDVSFGVNIYENAVAGDDFAELMTEFADRLRGAAQDLAAERAQLGIPSTPLTADDCIPGSRQMNYADQVLVIKPETLTASAQTQDNQLFLAKSGFGIRPESSGSAIFGYDLHSGEHCRRERHDMAGIIHPEKMPEWAVKRLTELKSDLRQEKPSVRDKLAQAKERAAKENAAPKTPRKDEPSL